MERNHYEYVNFEISTSFLEESLKFDGLMDQLEAEKADHYALEFYYLFNKIVSLCVKKGKKKVAMKQVLNAFQLLKQFFRFNPFFFLKMAALQIEPFIFLHKIPRGNKEFIYPRILPTQTRTHNALNIIVKQAFQTRMSHRSFSVALAYAILDNCMPNNPYQKKVREVIEVAELHKRNIKHKRRGKKAIPQLKRRERFKLFKKINSWK